MKHRAVLFAFLFLLPLKLVGAEKGIITPDIFHRQLSEACEKAHALNSNAKLGRISLRLTQIDKITEATFTFFYTNNLPFWERLLHEIIGYIELEYRGDNPPMLSQGTWSIKNAGGIIELPPSKKEEWKESLEIACSVVKAAAEFCEKSTTNYLEIENNSWVFSMKDPLKPGGPTIWIFVDIEAREVKGCTPEFAKYIEPLLLKRNWKAVVWERQ